MTLRLVAAQPADADFLYAVVEQQFRPQVEALGRKWAVAGMQEKCRRDAASGQVSLVEVDGRRVGFLLVEHRAAETWVDSLVLVPAARGQGIGTRVVADLLRAADAAARPVRLGVLHGNRARAFWERQGFTVVGDFDPMHWLLERLPATPAPGATLHFFCGKAGAGKSTLAQRLAAEHGALLLSEDVWLSRLYGDEMRGFDDYVRRSQQLKTVVAPLVVDVLASGRPVVMDFQANTRSRRQWFRSIFEAAPAAHVLHWVQTPEALCLQRIAQRNVERPEGSSHLSEADFHHVSSFFEAPAAEEGFNVRTHGA